MIILYADDDAEDRETFSDALKEVSPEAKLILANHGKEAIHLLQTTHKLPDYIFLDMNMPIMNGQDCLINLKSIDKLKNIPVIMYTTTSNKKELQKLIDLGAKDFLVKDVTFQGIKESLRKAIL
jgi:CheY-like chemotaxis protein